MIKMTNTNDYVINLFYNYSIKCENGIVSLINGTDVILNNIEKFIFVKIDSKIYIFLKSKTCDSFYIYELTILELKKIFEVTFKKELFMDDYYIGIISDTDNCLVKLTDFSIVNIPNEKSLSDDKIKECVLNFKKDCKCKQKIVIYGSYFDFIDYTDLFSGIIV